MVAQALWDGLFDVADALRAIAEALRARDYSG